MDTSTKTELIQLYKNKFLAIRNYKSDKKEFVTNDFINIEVLEDILEEVATGESDITPAGKSFLTAYYGFDDLANILFQRNTFVGWTWGTSIEQIHSWLETLVPMETMRFIEESRGTIKPGQSLREDLLPPEDL